MPLTLSFYFPSCSILPCVLQIRCPSGYGCVNDRSNLCDGMQDCMDGSDEDPKFCAAFDCKVDGRVRQRLFVFATPPNFLCSRSGVETCLPHAGGWT